MLKLIDIGSLFFPNITNFKTSHVKVNLLFSPQKGNHHLYFKTSHVKVNHSTDEPEESADCNFKTSHVKVNLAYPSSFRLTSDDFKTSHVKVNPVTGNENYMQQLFQNIPC